MLKIFTYSEHIQMKTRDVLKKKTIWPAGHPTFFWPDLVYLFILSWMVSIERSFALSVSGRVIFYVLSSTIVA